MHQRSLPKHPELEKLLEPFREKLAEINDISQLDALRALDEAAEALWIDAQAKIREVLNITNAPNATVRFQELQQGYKDKDGNDSTYHYCRVTWNESQKSKAKTIKSFIERAKDQEQRGR